MLQTGPAPTAPTTAFRLGEVGALLLDAGVSVTDVRADLQAVRAVVGGRELAFSVLPELVIVNDRTTGAATVVDATGNELGFRQAAQAARLARSLRTGALPLADAAAAIAGIRADAPRHAAAGWLVGSALIAAGLAVVMRTPWWAVATAVLAGLVVGAITLLADRVRGASAIAPFVAALVSTAIVGGVANLAGFTAVPLFAVCAPVALLVPGMLITNALLELTGADIVTGSARLASGVIMLGFMAAGIAAGAALTGLSLDSDAAMLVGHARTLGPATAGWTGLPPVWLTWVGVVALAVGVGAVFGAGIRLTATSIVVMLCTYALLVLLTPMAGTVVASGATLCVLFIAARVIETFAQAIPATVTFQPAFLLLVPGTVGLVALAAADVEAVLTAVSTFVALCIGTKLGSIIVQLRPGIRR